MKTKTIKIPFVGKKEVPWVVSQLIDQTLHALAGAGVVALAWFPAFLIAKYFGLDWLPPLAALLGLLVSIPLCLVRELVFQYPIRRWWDTLLDTVVWVIGAVVAATALGASMGLVV